MAIDPSQRQKRFIVIPRSPADAAALKAATTWRLMRGASTHRAAAHAGRTGGRRAAAKKAPPALKKATPHRRTAQSW